jgi:hypothetical protein
MILKITTPAAVVSSVIVVLTMTIITQVEIAKVDGQLSAYGHAVAATIHNGAEK